MSQVCNGLSIMVPLQRKKYHVILPSWLILVIIVGLMLIAVILKMNIASIISEEWAIETDRN